MHFSRIPVVPVVLSVLAASSGFASLKLPPKPAPCPDRWLGLIGKYKAVKDGNILLVLESAGSLQILGGKPHVMTEVCGDSFRLAGGTPAMFRRDSLNYGAGLRLGAEEYQRSFYPGELGEQTVTVWRQRNDSLWAMARAASPPREKGRFARPDLVEIRSVDPEIGTPPANPSGAAATEEPVYRKFWLQRPAALALARAHRRLKSLGYGLVVNDAYRPWYITKYLKLSLPPEQGKYMADPAKGSHHNRGTAVDVALFELATGRPADMGYGPGELSERASSSYPGGTSLQRWHRLLLRSAMAANGFRGLSKEWWHFRHIGPRPYRLMNVSPDELESKRNQGQ